MATYATRITIMAETVFACDIEAASAGDARELASLKFWTEASGLRAELPSMPQDQRDIAERMAARIEDTYSKARAYGCEAHARKR